MLRIFNQNISQWELLLFAGDIGIFCLSVLVGLNLQPKLSETFWYLLAQDKYTLFLIGLTYLTVLYIADLYDIYLDFRSRLNISRVILSALAGTLLVFLLFYYVSGPYMSSSFIEWQGLAFTWLLALWRYSFSVFALPHRLCRQVLIVGAGKTGRRIAAALHQCPSCGLSVAGFVDDDPNKCNTVIDGAPVLGKSDQLKELVDQHKISMLVLAITHEKSPALINALTRLSFNGCQLVDMPNLFEFLTAKVPIDYITDIWLFLHNLNRSRLMYRQFKKVTDLAITLCGLALTWPLFILISVAIRLDSPGPIFFRQERFGKDGKPFQIVKFRTMVQDAERFGAQWACKNDPRITRVGRILRKLRLDELPQLINIFKGEMSLIGPRPEREVFIREFQEPCPEIRQGRRANDAPGTMVICNMKERLPYYSHRLVVKPGLTGWAQVMYPYAASIEDTREKLCYDLYYIKNMGFFLDLAIILKTIRIILFGRGR